jgi:hypothetical protein
MRAKAQWRSIRLLAQVSWLLLAAGATAMAADPPFHGTIFFEREIVRESDPSAFERLEEPGQGRRRMYDRRPGAWVVLEAFLFRASFDDGLSIEVQVNPEFESVETARSEALKYMHAVGQLPTALRRDVKTIWIHKGLNPFGGGNNNLLIHTGQAGEYLASGILEETLIHEAVHTSVDAAHARAPAWVAAQQADPVFISTYARDHPQREDLAESYLPYFAVRYRADRIQPNLGEIIQRSIPNRIAYFDAQDFDMYPVVPRPPLALRQPEFDSLRGIVRLRWTSKTNRVYAIEASSELANWREVAGTIRAADDKTEFELNHALFAPGSFFRVRQDP